MNTTSRRRHFEVEVRGYLYVLCCFSERLVHEYGEGIAMWFPGIKLTGYLYLLSMYLYA